MCAKVLADALGCKLKFSRIKSTQISVLSRLSTKCFDVSNLIIGDKLNCGERKNKGNENSFVKDQENLFQSEDHLKYFLKSETCECVYDHLIKCKIRQFYPSISVLHLLAQYFSLRLHSEGLETVKKICFISDLKEFRKCSDFSHYNAQLIWMNGNIKYSMISFMAIRDKNYLLKEQINLMIQKLIILTFSRISKASLVLLSDLAEGYSVKYNNFSVLGSLWYSLFFSNWYEDQKKSASLLSRYQQLRELVEIQVPNISRRLLFQHKISDYQRLLETVLQCNMEKSSGLLLRALFDYYYKTGYKKGCIAVMKCCKELDVYLTSDQMYKYQILTGIKQNSTKQILDVIKRTEFKFKF